MNVTMFARLTFDARGEFDLRPAGTSHIALVRDKAEYEYSPEGQMQPESCDQLFGYRLQGKGTSLFVDTPGHVQVSHEKILSAVQQHLLQKHISLEGVTLFSSRLKFGWCNCTT